MRNEDLEWTPDRVEHIARHSLVLEEVEEVFASAPVFQRARGCVYEAWGQTQSGQQLRRTPVTDDDMAFK